MQESMVKFLLVLMALVALALGAVFLLIPGWFLVFSGAESPDVAWLRLAGASLISMQGFGLAIAAFRRRDTNLLIALIALSSTVQTGVLWYSLFTGEFGAEVLWPIVVPGILATGGVLVLWAAWLSRRRSVHTLGGTAPGIPSHPDSPGAVPDAQRAPGDETGPL